MTLTELVQLLRSEPESPRTFARLCALIGPEGDLDASAVASLNEQLDAWVDQGLRTVPTRWRHRLLRGEPVAALPLCTQMVMNLDREDGDGVLLSLSRSPFTAGLRGLSIVSNHAIDGDLLAAFFESEHLSGLRTLSIAHVPLDARVLGTLGRSEHLRGLESLSFTVCKLGPEGAQALAESTSLDGLEVLEIRNGQVGNAGVEALAQSPVFAGLRELRLTGFNRLGREAVATLAASEHLSELKVLALEGFKLDPQGAKLLANAPNLTKLESLGLDGMQMKLRVFQTLLKSPNLTHLKSLSLANNPLPAKALGALTKSPRLSGLEVLGLRRCDIDDAGAEAIAASEHLPQLRELDLSDNEIGVRGALAVMGSGARSALEHLNLAKNPFGGEPERASEKVRPISNLRVLSLKECPVSADFLSNLPALPQLRDLDLTSSLLDADNAEKLAEKLEGVALERLELGHNTIESRGLRALVAALDLTRLKHLGLLFGKVGDEGAAVLGQSDLACLEVLLLGVNGIGPVGMKALASSGALLNLKSLNLNANPVGDVGIEALVSSDAMRGLEVLGLDNVEGTDEGAETMASASMAKHLTSLHLGNNAISDRGAVAIAGSSVLHKLELLNLNYTGVGVEGAKAMGKSSLRSLEAVFIYNSKALERGWVLAPSGAHPHRTVFT